MQGLYFEERTLSSKTPISWDIAHHIYARGSQDKVIVITDTPAESLSAVRKQWFRLLQLVQRERSSTLNAARIRELSNQINWMQKLSFTSKDREAQYADILFLTPDAAIENPPVCLALYITSDLDERALKGATRQMPENAIAVRYIRELAAT